MLYLDPQRQDRAQTTFYLVNIQNCKRKPESYFENFLYFIFSSVRFCYCLFYIVNLKGAATEDCYVTISRHKGSRVSHWGHHLTGEVPETGESARLIIGRPRAADC